MKLNIANPLVSYISIWLLTIFLVNLQLTTNLLPLNTSTLILVFANIITFIVIYTIFSVQVSTQKQIFYKNSFLPQIVLLRKYIKVLLLLWLAGTIFEIIISGGGPLQWALIHLVKNYTNFGIKSFHGLMNSLYLFSTTAIFFDYLICGKKKALIICLVLLLWPVIMIERGILFGIILQMFCVYSIAKGLRLGSAFKGLLLLLGVLILFGVIGDIRTAEAKPFVNLVVEQHKSFFSYIPSGFLWVYVYITSPLNNIIANIDHITPTFTPFYSFIFFVPTAIRNFLSIDPQQLEPLHLVASNLNVSTFYSGFIADFGMLWTIVIVAIIQLIVTLFYLIGRSKIWALLGYSVLFQCVVFSIFFNLFFSWVYVFQIVLAVLFNEIIKNSFINKQVAICTNS